MLTNTMPCRPDNISFVGVQAADVGLALLPAATAKMLARRAKPAKASRSKAKDPRQALADELAASMKVGSRAEGLQGVECCFRYSVILREQGHGVQCCLDLSMLWNRGVLELASRMIFDYQTSLLFIVGCFLRTTSLGLRRCHRLADASTLVQEDLLIPKLGDASVAAPFTSRKSSCRSVVTLIKQVSGPQHPVQTALAGCFCVVQPCQHPLQRHPQLLL